MFIDLKWKSYISHSADIIDCCCYFNILRLDHIYRGNNAYGIGYLKSEKVTDRQTTCCYQWQNLPSRYMRIQLKVYTFELGYSFFMVLGSMFLAQICLLLLSQIFIANILKLNCVQANEIEISKDYC